MHNLVSTPVNMFSLEEERTSKWFSFTNTTCMHRIFTSAWDQENSWNHILNKNLLIEGITRYILKKKQKQSFREKVFSWESHETLMSFRHSWEKMRFSPVKKVMRIQQQSSSWECHFLMKISWESHEILMSFQFSWEKWDSHEQKSSWEILMRIGKLSWECHFLMRISWNSHENSKTLENFWKGWSLLADFLR